MPYLQPVGAVMSLFCHHQGKYALECSYDGEIDVVASRTENKVYLHLVNTDRKQPQRIALNIGEKGRMYVIAADPRTEITQDNPEVFAVEEREIDTRDFVLPSAAVAAIEIEV
jgi:hypothetical protein